MNIEKILLEQDYIKLDKKAVERFITYSDMLIEYNKFMNLTSITDKDEIAIKHFVDSLTILRYVNFERESKIVDVGTGAGFPGIPLLIAKNDINLTLIDSLQKRLDFLNDVLNSIDLKANLFHFRAEDGGKLPEHRENYDYVTSRAVARLNVLAEYCLPYVKPGGYFIALKGSMFEKEITEAENAIKILGGQIEAINKLSVTAENDRAIILIKKISSTPENYPRKSKKIMKMPL